MLEMNLGGGRPSPTPPSRAVITPEYAAHMKITLARMSGAIDRVAAILGPTPDVSALLHCLGWLESAAETLADNAPLEHTPGVPYNPRGLSHENNRHDENTTPAEGAMPAAMRG